MAPALFTFDATLPRAKASLAQWVQTPAGLLDELGSDDSLSNRVRHLP